MKKNIAIVVLALAFIGSILWHIKNPITKTETKTVTKETIKYVDSHTSVSGGTTAVISPQGTTISGSNLTITNTTTLTETSTVRITEKVVEKFATPNVIIGVDFVSIDSNLGVNLGLKEISVSKAIIYPVFVNVDYFIEEKKGYAGIQVIFN